MGPALLLVGVYLVWPVVRTTWTSLTVDGGLESNYFTLFSDPSMLIVLRNNILWLVERLGALPPYEKLRPLDADERASARRAAGRTAAE